ncbi:hypothetical protein LXA43DRAFT_1103300 [Ganoderma leucocontextum]|nr:hypothetical protein LXA43DRAFT_1103300 [Ganoderma leucocontextum]
MPPASVPSGRGEDIQATNRQLFQARAYGGQPQDLRDSNHRWLLRKSDTRSLYRQHNKLRGIRTVVQPQVNVDQWLNPKARAYNKTLASAVFHYSARAEKGDCFEVCVATSQMRDAAWKYGHGSQVILDGTFGVCDSKVLLFIAIGIDEMYHGVPLAFFLFSAPSGNAQTSSGYNTEILTKLLESWKQNLTRHRGQPFAPVVAITDTDLKERGALVNVICKFHLRQSWRNHRTRCIKGTSTLHTRVRARLRQLEDTLIDSVEHAGALEVVALERDVIAKEVTPLDADLAAAASEHLEYLVRYWLTQSLAELASTYGDSNVVVDGFASMYSFIFSSPTSFRGGDLVEQKNIRDRVSNRSHRKGRLHPHEPQYAILTADSGRDDAATALLDAHQVSVPTFDDQTRTFEFECFSSLATLTDVAPRQYALSIGTDGSAACSCPDFLNRSHACKHLRAALTLLNTLRAQGLCIPDISIPVTHEEAHTRFHGRTPIVSMPSTPTTLGDEVSPSEPSARPATPAEELPSMLVKRRAAQLVEDIVRESGDIFADPGDRRFAAQEAASDTSKAETPGDDFSSDSESTDRDSEEESDTDQDDPAPPSTALPVPRATVTSSRDGVVRQAVGRVLHDLEGMSPALQQMYEHLKGAYLDTTEIDRTSAAKGHLDALSSQLGRVLLDATTGPTLPLIRSHLPSIPSTPRSAVFPLLLSSPPPFDVTTTCLMARKRVASTLLPPSPEKQQCR